MESVPFPFWQIEVSLEPIGGYRSRFRRSGTSSFCLRNYMTFFLILERLSTLFQMGEPIFEVNIEFSQVGIPPFRTVSASGTPLGPAPIYCRCRGCFRQLFHTWSDHLFFRSEFLQFSMLKPLPPSKLCIHPCLWCVEFTLIVSKRIRYPLPIVSKWLEEQNYEHTS